jgi:dolichol-phosphate mannosyltransferase
MTTSANEAAAASDIRPATRPGSVDIRARLGVREFVLGRLSLAESVRLAGVPEAEFIDLLSTLETLDTVAASSPGPSEAAGPAPRLTVVVPVFNEEENLPVLHARLSAVLPAHGHYEILFVDDGSHDRSVGVIVELQRQDPAVKLVRFSRNFGHQAAITAGIAAARGEAVILMDCDLQDPPELLPELVQHWEDGFEVVYAVRQTRDEGFFKRSTAAAFYRLLRTVSNVEIPVDAGDFCLLDRKVVDVIAQLPEKNRYLRGLRSWAGFRQVGVPYDRPARHAGEAKYTTRKMAKLALDGVMSFTSLPLKLASYMGFLTAAAGIVYLGLAVFARLTTGALPNGWTSLVAIILILGGAQLIVTGFLGAYIARIYDETKGRPMYVVAETLTARSGNPTAGRPATPVIGR